MNRFAMALIAGSALLGGAAHAGPEETIRIDLKGVDLNAPAGAATALSRIGRSATDFCRVQAAAFVVDRVLARDCRRAFIAKAVLQLDAPVVTARYETRTGRRPILLARE